VLRGFGVTETAKRTQEIWS